MGWTIKIIINNLPSLPPIIFKEKRIRDKTNIINIINTFIKRKKASFSKNNEYSIIFNTTTIT
ncbi:MAG: hypothetical protein ACFE9V_02130 [Candidatus Hodarchaeota archaeon]